MKCSTEERLSLHRSLANLAVVKGSNSMQNVLSVTLDMFAPCDTVEGLVAFAGPEQAEK